MRALFTRPRGELLMGDTPARRWAPRSLPGLPCPAGPGWAPLPSAAAPRPQSRHRGPPTQDTLRENGLPQREHRPRRSPALRGMSPSPGSRVPSARQGAAPPPVPPHGASPAGAGSPRGRTALSAIFRARRAGRPGQLAPPLVCQQRTWVFFLLPWAVTAARKIEAKGCHSTRWRGKEELTRLAACTNTWLTTRGPGMSELALCSHFVKCMLLYSRVRTSDKQCCLQKKRFFCWDSWVTMFDNFRRNHELNRASHDHSCQVLAKRLHKQNLNFRIFGGAWKAKL